MKSYDNTRGLGAGWTAEITCCLVRCTGETIGRKNGRTATIKLRVWKGVSILAVVALLGLWAVAVRRR